MYGTNNLPDQFRPGQTRLQRSLSTHIEPTPELREALEQLRGKALYYPCSGRDFCIPIRLLTPYIRTFWFVDIGYFRSYPNSGDRRSPMLLQMADWKSQGHTLEGPAVARMETRYDQRTNKPYPYLEPCTRRELYVNRKTGTEIEVNWRRGFGEKSIVHVKDIGIFMHRGDSQGEGGSGVSFLSSSHRQNVFDPLPNGALIISDGSNTWIEGLRRFDRKDIHPEAAYAQAKQKPFNKWKKRWTCVGHAGKKYGPTLIWRITDLT